MRPLLLLLSVTVSACSASPGQEVAQPEVRGDARALDGDTVSIDFRFSGADSVEKKQQC